MPIEEIELLLEDRDPPPEVTALVEESDRRIDALFHSGANKRYPKYLPSDPLLIFSALRYLTEKDLPIGRVFCEWGSGFGVATCLASLLGYEAYGLEIQEDLVDAARSLAADQNLDANFLCTSYLPEGIDSYSGLGGEELIVPAPESFDPLLAGMEPSYEGMDTEISEIDVFYVYPWPLEQEFMQNLFHTIAVEGAILLAFHSHKEIRAFRKTGPPEDDYGL